MDAMTSLPVWKTQNIYSSLEGADYLAAFDDLDRQLQSLETYFDAHRIRRLPDAGSAEVALSSDNQGAGVPRAQTLEQILDQMNSLGRLAETLEAFVYAFLSTNSYDTIAARETSKLELRFARLKKLNVRFRAWIGSLATTLPRWLVERPALAEYRYFLEDSVRQSRYLMAEELESLAADLCLDGGAAFGKLQGNVTSQLKVTFERDGKPELLPVTVVRNLCFDSDAATRERAYRAEIAGWESIRTTVAACLNGVKGTAHTLAKRRGRASVLDAALDENRVDRETLDAMLGAIREALPVFRRYLSSKAQKLGRTQLRWWDLFAPLGAHKTFSWGEARQFIIDRFGRFGERLGDFARRSFDEHWIDAGPRDGKRGGAFCMPVIGVEESRVLMNFDGSYDQVSTLAHELGHAFHNECQRGLPPLLRGAPSTLAETASIFCETLVAEATLAESRPDEQLAILETQLCGATQVCVDILSRYIFESAVFERRAASELSADDFCQLMREAQSQTYADAVDPSTYHPYMWLWKPHYYSYSGNFYNFPYAFGHLFSLGLYAIYRREGESFVQRYEALLRATGQNDAAPLAARFGIDIRQPEFWRASLAMIANQVGRFEALSAA